MTEFLYRFRPLKRLLEQDELRNQEIYFAEPEQLNDPMEGFRDVFWKGDTIVWKNFFRHYIACLNYAFSQQLLIGEEEPIGRRQIPVFNHGNLNDVDLLKEIKEEILNALFGEPCITTLIGALAARTLSVRRNELAAHLRNVHLLALYFIREAYSRRGYQPAIPDSETVVEKLRHRIVLTTRSVHQFKDIEKQRPISEHQIDTFYAARQRLVAELDLIHLYSGRFDFRQANRNFVYITFPDEYVQKVESLVYPEWYTACFMRDCRNSAVWGSYGDNHTAAGLKFRVAIDGGMLGLQLKRAIGINGNGPIPDFVNYEFHQIKYESNHLPVDFFHSLGRFPISILKRYWYADEVGNPSPLGDDIFRADDEWRKRYWDTFYHDITRKLRDWSYEEEYRLILVNRDWDFREPASRKFSYRFSDLDAVIFGMKTPMKAKLEICKIIEEKCRKEARQDFKFYQAYYDRSTGTIEHAEMRSLEVPF